MFRDLLDISNKKRRELVNEKHLYLYLRRWFGFFLRRGRRHRRSLYTTILIVRGRRVLLVVVTRIYDDKHASATF